MDKWYYYKAAVRLFIEHTAERWMQTQLKQKVWNNTFLQKLMICKKLLFVLFLIQKGDTYNYQVIYMSDLAGQPTMTFVW